MQKSDNIYDVLVVGAGGAGLFAALAAAERGARVCLLEASDRIGGTLHWANGELSAAGTKRQAERGITDSADNHYREVIKLSKGLANPAIVDLAVRNAAGTVDWLYDHGFEMDPEVPKVIHSHQAYETPRTYWGTDQARSIILVLETQLKPHLESGAIVLEYETRLDDFLTDSRGDVTGAIVTGPDGQQSKRHARRTVLASGGCTADSDLFEDLHGFSLALKAHVDTNTGQPMRSAMALGAHTKGAECYTPAFNAVLEDAQPASALICRLNTIPEWRLPWEIYVNARGERFVREDGDSIDERERLLFDQPDMTAWMVFDSRIDREAPGRFRKWYGQYADNIPEDPFNELFAFTRADTIEELADKAGIDAEGLAKTIEAFNQAQQTGTDPAFGREHMPVPIQEPPFYAIRFRGCAVFSAAGLVVDDQLQVLRKDGTAIGNLYAAGEILGSWQTMGGGNSSGMMATPALTFGRLLGEKILNWEAEHA